MGYSLIPKNKIETIDIGAFSWPIFLQKTGAGFVLGYGAGRTPGSYVYQSNNIGSPVSNDGYKVSVRESKAMALCMRGYISVSAFINKAWEEKYPNEEERDKIKESVIIGTNKPLYNSPMGQKRLEELVKIADFIEKSGGFKIV